MSEKKTFLEKYTNYALIINIVAAVFYLLGSLGLNIIETFSVIIFFITVGSDLALVYLILASINRNTETGQQIKKICWIYLVLFLFAILLMLLDSLTYSFIEVGNPIRFISIIGAQFAYYIIFGFGIFTSLYYLRYNKLRD
ncbi:MAG: hypothetical protein ACTSQI_20160 [Candidatus Helarchaeota archaeon]